MKQLNKGIIGLILCSLSSASYALDLLEAGVIAFVGGVDVTSDRSIAEIDRIFAPQRFCCAGSHGTELRLREGDVIVAEEDLIPVQITSPSALHRAAESSPYAAALEATGGTGSYQWAIVSGTR